MRRIISVLLAVCMVFSMTVMAAPVQAPTVESVQEDAAEQAGSEKGELNNVASASVKPGLNILTGTTEPLTGENAVESTLKTTFSIQSGTTLTVAKNPSDETDSVLRWNIPVGTKTTYPTLGVQLNSTLANLIGHHRVHFKYNVRKDATYTDADTYNAKSSFWIMHTSGSANNVVTSPNISVNAGWASMDKFVDMLKLSQGATPTESQSVSFIRFQSEVLSINRESNGVVTVKADTVPTDFYFDNMYIVPAYEFNYYTPDGETLLKTEYKAFDSDGSIITSITPEVGLYGDYYIHGWSTSVGGEAVGTYQLNNENVTFYATEYIPAITVNAEGKLASQGAQMTLTPVVLGALKDTLVASKGEWTIDDSSVASIVTNKNGSATVTALKEGTAKATFTVADVSTTYDISVVFPYEVDLAKVESGTAFDIQTAGYTAMVVTAEGNAETVLSYAIDGGESKSVTVKGNADGSVRDNYFDLTADGVWAEGASLVMTAAGDAEISSIKLYSAFDPAFYLDVKSEGALLSLPGEELVFTAEFESALNGVYNEGYTWSVTDENDVVSHKAYADGTLKIRAKAANGTVIVTATSKEDESYSVSKTVYVNVDTSKYSMYYDALGASQLSDTGIKKLTDSKTGDGTHEVTVSDDVIGVDRTITVDTTTGGFGHEKAVSIPATHKYFVVKTTDTSTADWIKFYYKWDSNSHSETNTTYSSYFKIVDNGDGTVDHICYLEKVPETAENITGFMAQITPNTKADIIYMYATSEEPDYKDVDKIAYTWDFNTKTFKASQNQGLTVFNGETMKATKAYAVLDGKETAVQVDSKTTLSDGTPIYRISTANKGAHGSCSPTSYPSNIKLEDYKYIWFKYRSNVQSQAKLYLMDTDKGGNESGWDSKYISFEKSDDWTTKVFYLPDYGFGACFNTVFTSMMFPIQSKTVLTDVQQDETGYYVPVDGYSYSKHEWIEFDEIVIANYDPDAEEVIPLEIAITLTSDKDAITTDGGSVTITPTVFANQAISTDAVAWSTNSGNVKLVTNEDGTVTVTAIANGEATITATAVEDPAFSASIVIDVTGQREKIAAYDFSYLCIGNSYSRHGYNANYSIWLPSTEEPRGMAASKPELDYYHRVQYYLTNNLNGTMTSHIIAGSGLEDSGELTTTVTTVEQAAANMRANAQFIEIKDYLVNSKPNVITVQLSENFQNTGVADAENFYDVLYGMIDEYRPAKSVVVCITPFGSSVKSDAIKKYAKKYGFYVADMTDINSYSVVPDKNDPEYNTYIEAPHPETGEMTKFYRGDNAWKYNSYLAWAQYPGYDVYKTKGSGYEDDRAEFRSHPGDKGMDEIAKRVFAQCKVAVPSNLEAEYIYVPTAIEITGADEITALDGSINLTVVPAEADASNDVVWSVDNEKIAAISEDGVLTAVNNGKVTVTAKSAYNSEIVATKTVTVSGQPAVYTLSYKAGTTDTVTNLPEADEYARDEYTLSDLVPDRNGYKFLGWSLTEGGETVTTVNVTKNTDVYAVWTLAEGWHFDEDGNEEGISFGGFNVAVKDGVGTVLSYDEGLSISDSTLLLDSANYSKLNTRISINTAEEDVKLVLELTTADGNKYSYSADVTAIGEQFVYSFDISDVTGIITGFVLKPTAGECSADVDWIEFERKALTEDVKTDVVNVVEESSVNLEGNKYEIESLVADADITFEGTGTVVIGAKSGDGKVSAGFGTNVVYNGNDIDGYVKIELEEKAADTNLVYAEIDGYQYKLDDSYGVYGMILPEGETKLVQVAEKTTDVAVGYFSKYYLASSTGVKLVSGLTDSFDTVDEISLRVASPTGLRFKAKVKVAVREEVTEYKVTEYGYVVALERDLNADNEQLTLDFRNVVKGACYLESDGTDKIFENTGTDIFFTSVLYGIPENAYEVNFVSKTFTKLTVDGKEYVVYGEPVTTNAYKIAKALEGNEELSEEAAAFVEKVISKVEG